MIIRENRLGGLPLGVALVLAVLLSPAAQAAAAEGSTRGVVTLDGKDLAAGNVVFHPEEGEAISVDIKDGKYVGPKMPSGKYRVTVQFPGAPKKYADPEASFLQVEVVDGVNYFDFSLTSE